MAELRSLGAMDREPRTVPPGSRRLRHGPGGDPSCVRIRAWRSSSVVEQGTHKPLVGGSNPPSATNHDRDNTALPKEGRVDSFILGRATIRSRPTSVT